MKIIIFSILIITVFSSLLFGLENDTVKSNLLKRKKVNLNSSFTVGTEYSLSNRVEFENYCGKINLKAEKGLTKGGLLLDIGAGYGYPVIYNKSHALFVNGNITYINIGLKAVLFGPTTMMELEYRKTWNHFSLSIVPFYRRLFMENPEIGIEYDKNSYGLRLGFIYSFWLK